MNAQPLISCRQLTKIYVMGKTKLYALNNIDLDISEGEFVAIMGASGSGKSTLMNLIGALDQPSQGHVTINGNDISELKPKALSKLRNETIGFIFQQFQLLPKKTAQQNVELPLMYRTPRPSNIKDMALACLETVGLKDRAKHRPMELSGGQQQRVAIARALAGQPKIILADEPTGALDSKTSIDIMKLLIELNAQGITIIVITHEKDVAAYAKRIVEISDGKVTSDRLNMEAA